MKKLRLNLDALKVDSYETEAAPAARGTVMGHIPTMPQCANTQYSYCPDTLCTCPPPR
jgi:hypothetical protein